MATRCEKHGLHYDASVSEGCVLCRREGKLAADDQPQPSHGTNDNALKRSLMVAAGLVLTTTLAFDLAHEATVHFVQETAAGIFLDATSPPGKELEIPVDPQLEEAMRELDILFGEEVGEEALDDEEFVESEYVLD
ncbi:MAG: hypothetical protein K0U98_22540 [Deltaproteobacteria bacterium]|nr:hypothetical protein [Deltaproteobacteria bacterium]